MILQKRGAETQRPSTNSSAHKTFYSFSVTPGRTNYIFKKNRPSEQIEVNCTTNLRTVRETDLSPGHNRHKNAKNLPQLKIEAGSQISCTSFMKSYVQKLKKERKRQSKKLRDSRNNKQQTEKQSFGNKIEAGRNTIYLAKQMDHIFILQRVPKNGGNGVMNTISLVDETYQRNKFSQEKSGKWEEPAWANKERIDKLIKQIRNSRNKIGDADEMPSISEELGREHRANEAYLPSLASKSREVKSRAKSKQVSRIPQINFKTLEPWRQDQNVQQFSIEEYNVK